MLKDLQLNEFLNKTASGSPVPGGGSIAALNAALSASLIEMVANLTIGKKGFEDVEDAMKTVAENAKMLRTKLTDDIDRDSGAYQQVVDAYKLPNNNADEKTDRHNAVQDALKHAAQVPLGVAKDAFKLIDLAGSVAQKGNRNAVTDAAVAVLTARTAVLAALYNVKINLSSIDDKRFTDNILKQIAGLEAEAIEKEKEILGKIKF